MNHMVMNHMYKQMNPLKKDANERNQVYWLNARE